MGSELATALNDRLQTSKAVQTGLLQDLEEDCALRFVAFASGPDLRYVGGVRAKHGGWRPT
jgi:hypothetical protein